MNGRYVRMLKIRKLHGLEKSAYSVGVGVGVVA